MTSALLGSPLYARPNVLVCVADDWGWPDAGAYGAKWLNTPNFDRVAQHGILFKNAFTNSPSCTPSRGVILTGSLPWNLGSGATLHGTLPGDLPTYPDILEANGYKIGHTGKGWGPGSITAGGRTTDPTGPAYNNVKLASKSTTGIHPTDYAANFKDFLMSRESGQPFCFWYGAYEPHRPYEVGSGRRKGGLSKEAVRLPEFYPDDDDIRDDFLDYAFEVEHMDNQLGQMISYLSEIGELDNTFILVTGDHGMPFPRMKKNLYELGAHVPFAIQWANKIASPAVVEDMVSFVDIAPTILAMAGIEMPKNVAYSGENLSLLWEEPQAKNKASDYVFMGLERHDIIEENVKISGLDGAGYPSRAVRSKQFLYIRNYHPEWMPDKSDAGPTHTVINKLMKGDERDQILYTLNYGRRPPEELYDVQADPYCMVNLAADPSFQTEKNLLANVLLSKQKETGDPRYENNDILLSNPHYRIHPKSFSGWGNSQ